MRKYLGGTGIAAVRVFFVLVFLCVLPSILGYFLASSGIADAVKHHHDLTVMQFVVYMYLTAFKQLLSSFATVFQLLAFACLYIVSMCGLKAAFFEPCTQVSTLHSESALSSAPDYGSMTLSERLATDEERREAWAQRATIIELEETGILFTEPKENLSDSGAPLPAISSSTSGGFASRPRVRKIVSGTHGITKYVARE